MSQALEQFQQYQDRISQYDHAAALLYWDLQTGAPKAGTESKLNDIGFFSTESFRLSTADEYGALFKALAEPSEYEQLSDAMKVTVFRLCPPSGQGHPHDKGICPLYGTGAGSL